MTSPDYRSGFACFVGRPNTGKSTLTNGIIGEKIAITSNRPQTTRHTIRGILTTNDAQLIVVDTPGLHRPRTLLGERLNEVVKDTFSQVDVIGFCLPADEAIGPGDRWILQQLQLMAPRTPIVGLVTKIDKVSKDEVAAHLAAAYEFLGGSSEVVPVSAVADNQVDTVVTVLTSYLPEGPKLYPDEDITDDETEKFLSELIREAVLEDVRDELPHSIACTIDEMYPDPEDNNRTVVHATIYVERDSQKGIVIGKKGSRLASVGRQARRGMAQVLGTPIYLDLHVKVLKNWQSDPKQLGKLGF